MKLAEEFDPIEVGEVDYFAFDFTADVGTEDIVAVEFSCRLTPFTAGADPAPQTRIWRGLWPPAHTLEIRTPDGSIRQKTGYFAVAAVGPMPASAAGATYIIGATAYLSGGVRKISLNSTLQCVLSGQ
jgi:hypothetical protein